MRKRVKLMKKIACLLFAVAALPLFSQDTMTLVSRLYMTTTIMSGGSYTMQVRDVGVVEKSESTGGEYTVDPDPFGYKDFVPPNEPVGVRGAALDSSRIRLTFLASSDNIHVFGYNVFRDGSKVGFSPDDGFTDTGLAAMTSYQYSVQAVDKSMNLSPVSDGVWVTTLDAASAGSVPHFVSGPYLSYVSESTAVVEFVTDKATTASLEYGETTAYGASVSTGEYYSEHVLTVSGLTSNTRYHYRVKIDDFGTHGPVASTDDAFYTSWGSDSTPPQFTQRPMVAYLSDRIATISFETDEDTMGTVFYGIDSIQENGESEVFYAADHSVTLWGLQPQTRYWYAVSMRDRSGNGPVSSRTRAFTTSDKPDRTAPHIYDKPDKEYLADRMAVITWKTDELSDSVVDFGPKHNPTGRQAVSHEMTKEHAVVLLNLQPHEQYSFLVSSTDPSGNLREARWEKHFTTSKHPDATPPRIRKVEVRTDMDSATIRWETDELTQGKLVYGRESKGYTNQSYEGKLRDAHRVEVTGLLPGTRYFFQILAKDPSGNEAQTHEYWFRTDYKREKDGHDEWRGKENGHDKDD